MTNLHCRFRGFAVALVFSPMALGAQQTYPLSYDHYYQIARPTDVALSPDGQRLAFVRSQVLEEENRTRSEIWMVTTDGSEEAYRVTSPGTSASLPQWSPDGHLLMFSSARGGTGSTWVLRMDKAVGEAYQIPGLDGRPLFSPSGGRIAFLKAVPPGPEAMVEAPSPVLTEAEERIVDRFDGRAFDWMNYRFDRRGYLDDPRDPSATPPMQIFALSSADSQVVQLTDMPVDVRSPAWRPDGQSLAFVADAHARDEHTYERADLWRVTLEGDVTRLTDDEFNYAAPDWSPDGTQIVVLGSLGLDVVIRDRWDHGSPRDLFVFSADGESRINLTGGWDLIPGAPRWSADGRWVYFTAGSRGDTHLFRVPVAGGDVEQLTQGPGRVGAVSFSADFREVAYTFQSPTEPGNVYLGSRAGSARRLTDLNRDLLAQVDLKTPEELTFTSADGTAIQGWLLPPVGLGAAEAGAPMIMTIHGGPHGAYGSEFSFDRHVLSGKGYYVLYINPRGSTGYGEAFRWGTWGSWGDEDYHDLMAGVDHALANYPIDPSRMGVTGYSYGGFMTNWIITQTARFSAAAAGASISNWVSDYGTSDIPRTKESEFSGPPWENEGLEKLMAASPIIFAGGVSTPTLFIHGESDHRVPIAEAEQMYTALKKQQVPAKFIRYPDSYHGGWTPWRYLHRVFSTVQWMGQWLAEPPVS